MSDKMLSDRAVIYAVQYEDGSSEFIGALAAEALLASNRKVMVHVAFEPAYLRFQESRTQESDA